MGAIRIGFARVPTKSPSLGGPEEEKESSDLKDQLEVVHGAGAVSIEQQVSAEGGGLENYRSQLVVDLVKAGVHEQVLEKGLGHDGEVTEQQMVMQVLSTNREEDSDVKAAAGELLSSSRLTPESRPPATYYTAIPLIHDRPHRRFDSVRLRDLRKSLDSGMCSAEEVDQYAMDLLEDCAEVSPA